MTTMTGAAAAYLAQVKAELSDLPVAELDEVLDDVADHLEEISAELDGEPTMEALETRIGSPRQYADELRTAAGYPPKSRATGGKHPGMAALRWGLVTAILTPVLVLAWIAVGAAPASVFIWIAVGLIPAALGVRALRGQDPAVVTGTPLWQRGAGIVRRRADALPDSVRRDLVGIGQPVWWVVRGAVGGVATYAVVVQDLNAFAFFIVGILGAFLSIWMARRSQRDRRWLWYLVPLNLVAVLALLILALGGGAWYAGSYVFDGVPARSTGYSVSYGPGLWMDDSQVTNLFPYDSAGRPLKDVRIYDQVGRPILRAPECAMDSAEPTPNLWVENLWPKPDTMISDGTCIAAAPPKQSLPPLTPQPSTPTK